MLNDSWLRLNFHTTGATLCKTRRIAASYAGAYRMKHDDREPESSQGYPSAEPPIEEQDLTKYIQLFLDHRWWIIGVTLTFVIVGALYAFLATPVYTATATVFIDRGSQKAPKEISSVATSDLTTELYFNSQLDIMKSREVAQAAFDALHLDKSPVFKDSGDPVDAFRHMISVSRQRDSALFNISVSAPYRDKVAPWANGVADAYDRVVLRKKLEYLHDADKLMAEQSAKMEKEYQRLRGLYGKELASTGSYFPDNQKAITDSRIQGLELKRNDVLIQKNQLDAQLSQLRTLRTEDRDPLSIAYIQNDTAIQGLIQQYNQAEKDLAQLLTQFTAKHPAVIKKRQEIDALKARIRRQALLILEAQESQYAALQQEYNALTADLAHLKSNAIEATQKSSQSESLEAGVDAVRKYMDLLVEKMREVDVAANLQSNAATIVDRAETPNVPSKPNKRMIVLMSFMLGLMASAGSVLLIQVLDRRIKDPEVLEKAFGLATLSIIPTHTEDTKKLVDEAFLNLRTSLMYASDHRTKRVWMIASPSSGEGKSSVTANLALILAASGDKVLVVDCDLRKPTLHKKFGLKKLPGLSGYLLSEDEDYKPYLEACSVANLALMPAGETPPNPPSLYDTEKFQRFLIDAQLRFDWVLIDTPPVLAVTDAAALAEYVDGCLLVARYRSTHLPLVERVLQEFHRIGLPVPGAVLNQFDWARHYYYKNYYYRHYNYYYGTKRPPTIWDKVGRLTKHRHKAAG